MKRGEGIFQGVGKLTDQESTRGWLSSPTCPLQARGHGFKNRHGFSEAIFIYSDTDMHRVEGFLNYRGGGAARKLQVTARE